MFFNSFLGEIRSLFQSDRVNALWIDATALSLGAISSFVEAHLWSPPEGYYILATLLFTDFAVGARLAWLRQVFETRKAVRVVYKLVAYTLLLFFAHNLGKYDEMLKWLPDAVFLPLTLMTLTSLVKNFSLLGYLPKSVAETLYHKIDVYKNEVQK